MQVAVDSFGAVISDGNADAKCTLLRGTRPLENALSHSTIHILDRVT